MSQVSEQDDMTGDAGGSEQWLIKHRAAMEKFKEQTTWTEFESECISKRGFRKSDVETFADSLKLIDSKTLLASIDKGIFEYDQDRSIITYGSKWTIIPLRNNYMHAERFFYRHFIKENIVVMIRVYLSAKKKHKDTILAKFANLFSIPRLGQGIVTLADPIIERTAAETCAVVDNIFDNFFQRLRGLAKDFYQWIRTLEKKIYHSSIIIALVVMLIIVMLSVFTHWKEQIRSIIT